MKKRLNREIDNKSLGKVYKNRVGRYLGGMNSIVILKEDLIVYKKLRKDFTTYIATLLIPKGSKVRLQNNKRSIRSCRKMRADQAFVLSIFEYRWYKTIDFQKVDYVTNYFENKRLKYKTGEMVYPDKFDLDHTVKCAGGIHFFLDLEDALCY